MFLSTVFPPRKLLIGTVISVQMTSGLWPDRLSIPALKGRGFRRGLLKEQRIVTYVQVLSVAQKMSLENNGMR